MRKSKCTHEAHMSILALKEKGENKSHLEWRKKFQKTLQRVSTNPVGDSRRGRWIWGIKRRSLIKPLKLCVCIGMLHISIARIICSLLDGCCCIALFKFSSKIKLEKCNGEINRRERQTLGWNTCWRFQPLGSPQRLAIVEVCLW